jgi:hypothetical protein
MKFEKEFHRDMGSVGKDASSASSSGPGSLGQPSPDPGQAPPPAEVSEQMLQRHEGQLSKFTNVVKGWQYRWFVLEPESGTLEYFLPEERARSRGRQHLAGAAVLPSEEDGHTFSVQFASGEVYKVRASQTRERQAWVDRLRATSHRHSQALAGARGAREGDAPSGGRPVEEHLQSLSLSALDAFGTVHDMLRRAQDRHRELAEAIEALPPGREREEGETVAATASPHCHDPKLLLVKATSQSTVLAMEAALALLQQLREDQLAPPVVIHTSLSVPAFPFSPSLPPSPTKGGL